MKKAIEIRTWPQRTNVAAIDVNRAVVIAEYPIKPQHAQGAVFNALASYEDRASHAVSLLESDQEFLRHAFHEDEDEIELEIHPGARVYIDRVLAKHDLEISDLDISNTREMITHLDSLNLNELFGFLVDWYDVIETHRDFGISVNSPDPWVERSRPGSCFLFHYMNDGCASPPDTPDPAALDLMMMTLDVADEDYTFGHLLRWAYYTRGEFEGLPRPALKSWQNLTA